MAHKCDHGKDSDICVLCATGFDDNSPQKNMKIQCPSCKKMIVQVSHSPGVVESGAEVECGACGNIWTPFPARDCGDKIADLGRRAAAGRPPIAGESATGQIQLRVTMTRKNAYVRAAKPQKLTAWIFEKLDKASGYEQI